MTLFDASTVAAPTDCAARDCSNAATHSVTKTSKLTGDRERSAPRCQEHALIFAHTYSDDWRYSCTELPTQTGSVEIEYAVVGDLVELSIGDSRIGSIPLGFLEDGCAADFGLDGMADVVLHGVRTAVSA